MAKAQKAGWYPDAQNANQERHWDGSAWGDTRVAPPQKRKRRGGLVLKIALGIVLGITVLVVGCSALFSAGVDEAQKESDLTSITQPEYDATKTGDSRAEVEARLGKPSSRDESSSEIEGLDEPVGSQCIYYNQKGKFASIYQFCFDVNGGKLESKSAF